MPDNLFSFLSARGRARPQRDFIRPSGRAAFSFEDAFAWAARFAHVFCDHGVQPGDRVAVQVEKSPQSLFLYLACLRAGAIYLPLNPAYTAGELQHLLGDSEPALFICSPRKLDMARGIFAGDILTLGDDGASGSLIDEARTRPGDFSDRAVGGDELAAILYTSGTTGKPKGAMLSHGNLQSNAEALRDLWQFSDADVLLHALPVFHTHGLFVATNVVLAAGASMLFLPKFDLDEVFRLMPQASVMMGVPTFYVRLLSDPRLNRDAVRGMRLFISGSAPLLAETHAGFLECTGHAILERYGMSETNMNTSNPYAGARKPGSVGLPLPGVDIRILDAAGNPAPPGAIGRIQVRGPNVFSGYWRQPEKTRQELHADGFFETGDLGQIDADGYLSIVGRGKDLIITGGLNVYPKEVETTIDALAGVEESAVFGVAHPDFGEGVSAAVVLARGAALDEAAIHAALKGQLAAFKLPKRVIIVPELPRNAMGKVQKNLLRAQYAALYNG